MIVFSEKDRDKYYELLELYASGKSIYDLSKKYGLSSNQIESNIKKAIKLKECDKAFGEYYYLLSPITIKTLWRRGYRSKEDLLEINDLDYISRIAHTPLKFKETINYINANTNKFNYITKYFNEFSISQIRVINKGILEGLDITPLNNPKYTSNQMELLLDGIKKGLDISLYANPEYNYYYMREILFALEDGVDISPYIDEFKHTTQIRAIRLGLKEKLNVSSYAKSDYSGEQMLSLYCQLKKGKSNNIDIIMNELEASGKFSILVKPIK